ncbi:Gfo/Idh/MocA family protein [Rubritalea tangerina]|uniref:Gfo/Idh/MocA family protein n=1 Tax=Rubritalea tangerina TaxID=430798 RepID=A0ABW4Z6V6_9BACT
MKFGIIGTGMIAHFHARAIQAMQGSELVACYGRDREKVDAFAAEYGVEGFTDRKAFFSEGGMEVVTIATPSGAHEEPAIEAMRAGKHVVCEKPLEVTLEKIDRMVTEAEKQEVVLAAILNRRFNEPIELMKDAVEEGRFGKLSLVEASIKWYRDQAYYDSAGWRGTWALDGGGALMNQSIHIIDQLLYIVGGVTRVSASMGCVAHERIEVEDTAVAILEFENGARGVIQGSTACYSSDGHPAEVNVCGSKGSVFLADEVFKVWDFEQDDAVDAYVAERYMDGGAGPGLGANDPNAINFIGHQRNFEEVVEAIKEGREPSVSGSEARKAVALIRAIYESAQNDGRWVRLVE